MDKKLNTIAQRRFAELPAGDNMNYMHKCLKNEAFAALDLYIRKRPSQLLGDVHTVYEDYVFWLEDQEPDGSLDSMATKHFFTRTLAERGIFVKQVKDYKTGERGRAYYSPDVCPTCNRGFN